MRTPLAAGAARPARATERRAAYAGLCGTLVGIGLARFAYAPLLPALIEAGWFAPAEAAYIGAANLVGYLAGALSAGACVRRVPVTPLLRATMLLAALTFFACALNLGFAWFLFWRFLSGLAGGVLMVASAPAILSSVAPERRGRVIGMVFAGVGIGIVAAGTAVPLLLRLGLVATWLGLGAVSLLLTCLAWRGWPPHGLSRATPGTSLPQGLAWPVAVLILIYALYSLGLVPHMVFFVDFIARGLGYGIDTGSLFWVVYGVGAIAGPLLAGRAGDRIGFGPALAAALALQLGAVLIPLLLPSLVPLVLSALIMGAFTPGMPPLVLGRLHELTHGQGQQAAWGIATSAFALSQAGGAWALSWVYAQSASYDPLFAAGGGALLGALGLSLLPTRGRPQKA